MPQPDPRFVGKDLPQSRFAGDDGSVDPAVEQVLAAYASGEADLYDVQRALVPSRLLVPTAATADITHIDESTGLEAEGTTHLSVVTFVSKAGWSALLAFTSVAAATAWDAAARPVPVTAPEAAASALEDGRSVLIVDRAGPVRVALSGTLLRALAMGRPAVRPLDDPDIAAAIDAALADDAVPQLDGWSLMAADAGSAADLTIVLRVAESSDPVAATHQVAQQVAHQVAERLAALPIIRDRCEQGIAVGIAAGP